MATEVVIPMLGITVERGKILKWFKSEGDRVEKGESIFEVEAEKVTTEVESPASGILKKILVHENMEVPVLTLVAIITVEGEEVPEKYLTVEPPKEATPTAMVPAASAEVSQAMASETSDRIRAVPAARKVARQYGIDLSVVSGSGPGGTILKKDVQNYMALSRAEMPVPKSEKRRTTPLAKRLAEREGIPLEGVNGTGPRGRVTKVDVLKAMRKGKAHGEAPTETLFGKTIPMNRMRRIIARRISQSAFTAPHIYFFCDVHMGNLIKLREVILSDFEVHFGVRVSINDFIIKAVGLTIREYPMLNASVDGENIKINPEINVGLAVALEEGLIVPAIHRADRCGLGDIAKMRTDLVARARTGKLTMEEIERGTFTVSSLAQFDITFFTAILNPPQSGILTVGKLDERLRFINGEVKTKQVTRFGLSVDHRIVDGAVAAGFLQAFKGKLESPSCTFLQLTQDY
ncbi:MAG: dihydrolipoamide acetyltransferase family protein [Thermodesulfobacteriota bacterium]